MKMIKVMILITTYNLERYIEQCFESVLNQKTTFDYKILVGDDASTDGTIEILREYQKKYPDKIELVLQKKNIGSLANSLELYEKCNAEYFAFLDGDDFWMTDDKLQKQVDFLEEHRNYVICGGNTRYLYEQKKGRNKYVIPKKYLGKSYSIFDYYHQGVPFVHTSSILFRNVIYLNQVPSIYYQVKGTFEEPALRGEDFRFLLHLNEGQMFIMKEELSTYRIHAGGIWQGSSEITKLLESVIYYNFNKKFWEEHTVFFEKLRNQAYRNLMKRMIKEDRFVKKYELDKKEHFYYVSLLNSIMGEV